jgi:two-component system, LuxR family, sensor kinase FixL
MGRSPGARGLRFLDGWLTEEQRQLPSDVLRRFRVVVGAAGLLLVFNLLYLLTLVAYAVEARLAQAVVVLVSSLAYALVLVLSRWFRSPDVPAFVLCAALTLGVVLATLAVDHPAAVTHSANMLVPLLTVYLLGPRRGFFFTCVFVVNSAFFHTLVHSGFGRERAVLADGGVWMGNLTAAASLLLGWGLSWLHGTSREESHLALERALETVRESESKLLSVIDSTDDVVLALDLEGRLVAANSAARGVFLALFGRELRLGEPFLELATPDTRELYRRQLERAVRGRREKTETTTVLGGQSRTVEVTFNPVRGGDGRVVGMTVFSRDITERKDAEAKLGEMHRSLLDVSRQAGMAEIATGVLHNVGNALNSVNVSADVVVQRVRGSRIPGLARAVELLKENASRLVPFLTEDPRGQQLPAYLEALSTQLAQEREEVLAEMRRLGESVDHIKNVVSMQQQHARVAGVVERVEVPALIDDALRLLAVSFERLGIQLRREYAEVPPVQVDRHKLLQILVNLVSNARQALLESGREDKQLTLRVERAGERLRIRVTDNGVGIAPEHLSRLFTQGFTTKKEGHGFGLHISALAAEELGGDLTCESAGRGQGATFRLELPLT